MTKIKLEIERRKLKSERDVQKEIRDYLLRSGRPFSITDASQSFDKYGRIVNRVRAGWPDISTLTKGGRFFAIEVKRGSGGVLSREQALILRKIIHFGGLIVIARAVSDVEEAEKSGLRQCDLIEIEKAIARKSKTSKRRPIDPIVGF